MNIAETPGHRQYHSPKRKAWLKDNVGRVHTLQKDWRQSTGKDDYFKRPNVVRRRLIAAAKARSKKNGVIFDLTCEDVDWVLLCPILGTELKYEWGGGRNSPDAAPSLDRIVPELGYVKGNVRVICKFANRIKNSCTDPAVFRRLAAYLEGCNAKSV